MVSRYLYSIHVYLYLLSIPHILVFFFFFFNDTATTEIYTLSLHDALPISHCRCDMCPPPAPYICGTGHPGLPPGQERSEEHTSELQSRLHLVCRLLLEKKKKKIYVT